MWNIPTYWRKNVHRPTITPKTAQLDKEGKHRIHLITGIFLYYSKIYPCIKPELNGIPSQQNPPTKDTDLKSNMILGYIRTYPGIVLYYYIIKIILNLEDDSTYLVLPQSWSRAAAWFIIGNNTNKASKTTNNSPVQIFCNTIKCNFLSSQRRNRRHIHGWPMNNLYYLHIT